MQARNYGQKMSHLSLFKCVAKLKVDEFHVLALFLIALYLSLLESPHNHLCSGDLEYNVNMAHFDRFVL